MKQFGSQDSRSLVGITSLVHLTSCGQCVFMGVFKLKYLYWHWQKTHVSRASGLTVCCDADSRMVA